MQNFAQNAVLVGFSRQPDDCTAESKGENLENASLSSTTTEIELIMY